MDFENGLSVYSVKTAITFILMRFPRSTLEYDMYAFLFWSTFKSIFIAQGISMDGRPKRIKMYAFSNENALVWIRPKSAAYDQKLRKLLTGKWSFFYSRDTALEISIAEFGHIFLQFHGHVYLVQGIY